MERPINIEATILNAQTGSRKIVAAIMDIRIIEVIVRLSIVYLPNLLSLFPYSSMAFLRSGSWKSGQNFEVT